MITETATLANESERRPRLAAALNERQRCRETMAVPAITDRRYSTLPASHNLDRPKDMNLSGWMDREGPSRLSVELVNPLAGPDWDHLVQSHPDAGFFHSSAWAKVLAGTYQHQPFYLHFSQDGKTVALLPLLEVASALTGRRAVCLPFSDSCSPLLFSGVEILALRRAVGALARERKWRHVEFRGEFGLATEDRLPATFYGHTLDLRVGAENLFSRFAGSVRRAIRKGEASGLTVHVERTPEALEEFISLHVLTRKRHGVPPQPRRFFTQIYQQIIQPGLGFVVLARRGTIPVAAAIFFVWGDKAIYKFGASDQSEQSLRGNNLVMWEAIRFLTQSGVQQLDFGRTAFEHEGLRRFKLGWGTTERTITYCRFETKSRACVAVSPRHSGISSRFFSRMPMVVNQVAGHLLYPHLD